MKHRPRNLIVASLGLLCASCPAIADWPDIRIDPPRLDPPRIEPPRIEPPRLDLPRLPEVRIPRPKVEDFVIPFKRQAEEGAKQADKLRKDVDREVDNRKKDLERFGGEAAEAAKAHLEAVGNEAKRGISNLASAQEKALQDTARNLAKSANDLVDTGQAIGRYAVREIAGLGTAMTNGERRLREGKIVDAFWHLNTDRWQESNRSAAQLAQENEIANQAMATAASVYGGPAGAAAYSAWYAYNATGDAELAFRVGITNGLASAATALPQGTAGQLAKKALATGAVGGIAVAASGGDQKAVEEAFVKQGGMVIMQAGKSYIAKKADAAMSAAEAKADAFCTSATGISCKPAFDALQRDKDGKIVLDPKSGLPKFDTSKVLASRTNLGNWSSSPKKNKNKLPGLDAITVMDEDWAIGWNKQAFTNPAANLPAVSITYIGEGSPYQERIDDLAETVGALKRREMRAPQIQPPKPELWVALGDVGTRESFFKRLFGSQRRGEFVVGDVLLAQTDVNARPGPADFRSKPIVLPKGGFIVISEIRELDAKGTIQRWARVDLEAN